MLTRELIETLFGEASHPLRPTLENWLAGSRRYAGFVEANAPKIRKKLHIRTDVESLNDLRLELEAAFCLAREEVFSVVYEPGVAGGRAGPDFAVSYTTSLRFMLEVTRTQAFDAGAMPDGDALDRLADVACGKIRQLVPGMVNVLLIGARLEGIPTGQLPDAMVRLQRRAEQGDRLFLRRYGCASRADFFAHYQRLSEMVVRDTDPAANSAVVAWTNPQARHRLPTKVRTALLRSLRPVDSG